MSRAVLHLDGLQRWFLCFWSGSHQKGIFNPFSIQYKHFFQTIPLNKITVTNQEGKYDTNVRGRRGEGKSKPKIWSSPYLMLRIYHPPHLYFHDPFCLPLCFLTNNGNIMIFLSLLYSLTVLAFSFIFFIPRWWELLGCCIAQAWAGTSVLFPWLQSSLLMNYKLALRYGIKLKTQSGEVLEMNSPHFELSASWQLSRIHEEMDSPSQHL